jgi:hypothetical protein
MSERKTPILLRRGPLSGEVMVIHRYTKARGGEIIKAALDGKQSVQADYDALVLTELLDPDAPDMVSILDGVADGESLTDEERAQVRAFRERLKVMVLRHNGHGHGAA